MIVYEATNIVNGVSYVGQTVQDFQKYIKCHIRSALNEYDIKRGTRRDFYDAIREHGSDNFEWKILCECSSKEELSEKETYYIQHLDTYKNGYNMTQTADATYDRTPDIRERISLSLKGHKRSKESIERQIDTMSGENHPLYGVGHTTNSIEKMKENSKGVRNAASQQWIITSPDGTVYNLVGGYHDFLKEHKLSRWSMDKVYKGEKDNYKGWKVERLPTYPSCSSQVLHDE